MISEEHHRLFHLLSEHAQEQNCKIYIVGGYVRDLLLESSLADQDVDFILEGDLQKFVQELQRKIGGEAKFYPRFLTAKVCGPTLFQTIQEIDFAHARVEAYRSPGSLPEVSSSTIREDLYRRDFSINAIALTLSGFLDLLASEENQVQALDVFLDPFGGIPDLEERKIRILHEKSFEDDPTRIFRALRYRERMGGVLETRTGSLLEQALESGALKNISTFRVFQELRKVFEESCYSEIFSTLTEYGVIGHILLLESEEVEKLRQQVALLQSLPESDSTRSTEKLSRFDIFLLLYASYLEAQQEKSLVNDLGVGKARWQSLKKLAAERIPHLFSQP